MTAAAAEDEEEEAEDEEEEAEDEEEEAEDAEEEADQDELGEQGNEDDNDDAADTEDDDDTADADDDNDAAEEARRQNLRFRTLVAVELEQRHAKPARRAAHEKARAMTGSKAVTPPATPLPRHQASLTPASNLPPASAGSAAAATWTATRHLRKLPLSEARVVSDN